jgi:hypothetical protein
MPILTHLNNDMNRINKRIVKAQMRQITEQIPDVPAPPVDSDVNQNFMSLMKSLTNILMNLREMYWYRFGVQPEGDADYEYDLPDVSDLSDSQASSGLSGLQSQRSQASSVYSQPISSVASSVSQPFYRRGVASPASSVYSQPVSSAASSSIGRLSSREGLSQYSQPRRDEESIISNVNYAQANALVINSLTKEVVNAQFLVEELIFGQLSKVQKQSLKQIIVKINKVKGIINTGVAKPIYIKLNKIISRILSSLKETGEGTASEFLLNTEQSIPPDAYDPLIGNGRKNRLLCPAMYNSHQFNPRNVNDNFCYNLAKRNI